MCFATRNQHLVPEPTVVPPGYLPNIHVPWSKPPEQKLTEYDTGRVEYEPGNRESVGGSRQIDISRQLRERFRRIWENEGADPNGDHVPD